MLAPANPSRHRESRLRSRRLGHRPSRPGLSRHRNRPRHGDGRVDQATRSASHHGRHQRRGRRAGGRGVVHSLDAPCRQPVPDPGSRLYVALSRRPDHHRDSPENAWTTPPPAFCTTNRANLIGAGLLDADLPAGGLLLGREGPPAPARAQRSGTAPRTGIPSHLPSGCSKPPSNPVLTCTRHPQWTRTPRRRRLQPHTFRSPRAAPTAHRGCGGPALRRAVRAKPLRSAPSRRG